MGNHHTWLNLLGSSLEEEIFEKIPMEGEHEVEILKCL